MSIGSRFTGRQITVMVVAVCVAVVGAPALVWAAAASFSSSSASTAAVTGTNSSGTWPAKGVYGRDTATTGSGIGVAGQASSASGYGVYSVGRLGSTGALVCSHCVSGSDINASTLPTVPTTTNAYHLGGQLPAYYGQARGFDFTSPQLLPGNPYDSGWVTLLSFDGFTLAVDCTNGSLSTTATLRLTNSSGSDGAGLDWWDGTRPALSNDGINGVNLGNASTATLWTDTLTSASQRDDAVGFGTWFPAVGRMGSLTFHVYLASGVGVGAVGECTVNGTAVAPA